MTTANDPTTPKVPTVTAGAGTVAIHRGADDLTIVSPYRADDTPDTIAADFRGALADAYRAGVADGAKRAERDADYRVASAELDAMAAAKRAERVTTLVPTGNAEPLRLALPDGRVLGIWAHHCDSCTSVDVWTERPGAADPTYHFAGVAAPKTGAPERQPVGVFAMTGGRRFEMLGGADATPRTGNRPEQSTVILTWTDAEL